jgi:hypothetical protein
MGRWLFLLGGPLIWAAHFGAIYLLTSAAYLGGRTPDVATFIAVVGLSALAIAAAGVLALRAARPREDEPSFWRAIALAGSILAIIVIIWQTLPVIALFGGTAHSASS